MKPISLAKTLVEWHLNNPRPHPWQSDKDPYKIWLSEIILQQTRVAQGTPYYLKFIEHYPTVHHLARASEDQVMSLWQGLGYYSRARFLHATAIYISENLDGIFPNTYEEILKLKGVGPYTAAAISSFAFDLPTAVVDGNVNRVITRLYGIEKPLESNEVKKQIQNIVDQAILKVEPAAFNQAIMDFGATHCTKANAQCDTCPFGQKCIAHIENKVQTIPLPKKKIKRTNRYFHYFCIEVKNKTAFQKRVSKDIWQGLYELPMIETYNVEPIKLEHFKESFSIPNEQVITMRPSQLINKQKLSHQDIFARFYYITLDADQTLVCPPSWEWMDRVDYNKIGMPRIIDLFLRDKSITLFG